MTNAVLEKRVARLEAEIRQIKSALPRSLGTPRVDTTSVSFKKLPRGVQASLRELAEGKIIGPFNSTEEFMADLNT